MNNPTDPTTGISADMRDSRETVIELASGPVELSILVPTYRDDPAPLVAALACCAGAHRCELIVFDDGSAQPDRAANLQAAMASWPGPAQLVLSHDNLGRSGARNRLIAHAQAAWLLLIDADMLPDDHLFLARYLESARFAEAPSLIAGGFSLNRVTVDPHCRLHALQSAASECLPAEMRSREPGRYVFTSNILVHRDVMERVAFDTGYSGWGWEDVDWGLRVAAAAPVSHIDNTATHLGLDEDSALMAKYSGSGANFVRLVAAHPEAAAGMNLHRAVLGVSRLGPLVPLLASVSGWTARQAWLPGRLRLFGLKLFRAAHYARAL